MDEGDLDNSCKDTIRRGWNRSVKAEQVPDNEDGYHESILYRLCRIIKKGTFCLFSWRDSPQWAMASLFARFLDYKQRRTTVGRTPLDEWSARFIDLYLTTNTQHSQQRKVHAPVGFEPTISAGERSQTYALDRAATDTDKRVNVI